MQGLLQATREQMESEQNVNSIGTTVTQCAPRERQETGSVQAADYGMNARATAATLLPS